MKNNQSSEDVRKDFENYKKFCIENNLKESNFETLQLYFAQKDSAQAQNSAFEGDFEVVVNVPLTNMDKLAIVEEFLLWSAERDYNLNYAATYIEYRKFLLKKGEV